MPRTMTVNKFAGTGGEVYTLHHTWPEDCFVQGGHSGIVFTKPGEENYATAYFEAFPDGSFIRGEGETLEDAEDACWAKRLKYLECPGHSYEPRGYRNGAGFCKFCGHFKSRHFTGLDLGQYCETCGIPTTYMWVDDWFFCELHPALSEGDVRYRVEADAWEKLTPEEQREHFKKTMEGLLGDDDN